MLELTKFQLIEPIFVNQNFVEAKSELIGINTKPAKYPGKGHRFWVLNWISKLSEQLLLLTPHHE